MADYRYLLGDILSGIVLMELPFTQATFSHVLNAPGMFTGTMPLQQSDDVVSVFQSAFSLGRSVLYVERDGVIIWGGILWTESIDFAAQTYTVNGEGWHSYFRKRILDEDKTYTTTEQVTILKGLVDWAQAQSGGNINVETGTVIATNVTRDRTYLGIDRKNIGEAMEQLAAVDNGFDFRYRTARNPDTGDIEVSLITMYPATGYDSGLVFELGTQMTAATANCDATTLVTNVTAVGAIIDGAAAPTLATVSDTSRYSSFPRLDDVVTNSDVSDSTTLTAYGNRRLARGAAAVCIPSIEVDPTLEPKLGSYNAGDLVTVRADVGLRSIDAEFRITEYTVNVGMAGDEKVAISFASAEVFD